MTLRVIWQNGREETLLKVGNAQIAATLAKTLCAQLSAERLKGTLFIDGPQGPVIKYTF